MGKKVKKKHIENSDKYERQKKLAAERQRRFKAKMTEEQLEKKRQRDRDRLKRLREEKKIKPIKEMKPSEQKKKRKQWRKYCSTYRKKQKALKNALDNTPPSSANEEENDEVVDSRQKEKGRKKVRRDRAKAYRTINKQAKEIKQLKRRVEKYKKRLQRELKNKTNSKGSPSPNKRVKELIGTDRVSPQVKKQLFVGITLQKQLKNMISKVNPRAKERQIMNKVIGTKILKRYRVQNYLKNIVSYKNNQRMQKEADGETVDLTYSRKHHETVRVKEALTLRRFFEDDLVSKMCPGKKDFVRKGKNKKQRRILLDTMKNLYTKFCEENQNIKIGYSTFVRCRPFWVTRPKARDRETCACITHENFEFLVSSLRAANVIKEQSGRDVLKSLVCSAKNEKCISKLCKKCKNNDIEFKVYDKEANLKYSKWKNIQEERNIKGTKKNIKRTVKMEIVAPVSEVIDMFKNALPVYKKHVFSMLHQANKLKKVRENLKEGELLLQIDFSQNYICKLGTEVQSMHFGASKKQVSLHTGVMHYIDKEEVVCKSFCTVADNLDHQCHAVWAHMRPVLEDAAERLPLTHTVHIFSDSPSSQYRNKGNLYLMRVMLPKFFKNLKVFTWNFSEPGHGKGSMDGVGGAIKRTADDYVNHGNDISTAAELVRVLSKNSSVMLAEVSNGEILEMKSLLPKNLTTLKGIMGVRQVRWNSRGFMFGSKLSCFHCLDTSNPCKHYHLMKVQDNVPKSSTSKKRAASASRATT